MSNLDRTDKIKKIVGSSAVSAVNAPIVGPKKKVKQRRNPNNVVVKTKPKVPKKPRTISKASVIEAPAMYAPRYKTFIISVFILFQQNMRALSLLGGTSIVIMWTVLRHISNGVNYDVVGQIGLAQQWTNGLMAGVQLGSTNYILKIPLYIFANKLDFILPIHRLLLLALLFNVVTFILLFVLYEKFMKLYEVKHKALSYIAIVWLATISGNVFWVDYANSRNLETVGGVLFVYCALKYIALRRPTTMILMALTGSIVFFADPLQFYICGVGVCVYAIAQVLLQRSKLAAQNAVMIATITALSYGASLGLLHLAKRWLHASFLSAPHTAVAPTLVTGVHALKQTSISTVSIFGANVLSKPHGINTIRELINLGVLVCLVGCIIKIAVKRQAQEPVRMLSIVVAVNYIIYIASGQGLLAGTSRYLIMVPLFVLALFIISSDKIQGLARARLQYGWLLLTLLSGVMLIGALGVGWPTRHSKDAHIGTTLSFMQQNNFKYALSSREVGVTTTYFEQGKATVLPMGCDASHSLQPTNLFYDNAAFKELYDYSKEVPIIIPGDSITFGQYSCSKADIVRQFGTPTRELPVDGVGTAFVYDASSVRVSGIDALVGHLRFTKRHKRKLPPPPPPVIVPVAKPAPAVIIPALRPLDACKGSSVEAIMAHPDDDLLFMNPALSKKLQAGCVRSVFVTAADDGRSADYWNKREYGIKAAYASMLHADNLWTDSFARVGNHTVSTSSLTARPSVGLVFMRLPDGNVDGSGFVRTGNVSLEALESGRTIAMTTIDGAQSYSNAELISTVGAILSTDSPGAIFTQLADGPLSVGDHSDHRAVGALVAQSKAAAKSVATTSVFIGYPIRGLSPNLSVNDTAEKMGYFLTYARQDRAICRGANSCEGEKSYEDYFSRNYIFGTDQQPALPY